MTRKSQDSKHVPFFDLRTPADLFEKMKADLDRLERTQHEWDAFNFFVTAEHMPDWLGIPKSVRKKHAVLRVVSDVANGAKHFKTNPENHKSVQAAQKTKGFSLDFIKDEYYEFDGPLVIQLEQAEEAELGVRRIEAVELGKKVLEFWAGFIVK